MSLSHQNRRLRGGDRRDGAGRMGAEWVWRAWEPHRPALPRTFSRHHVDPGQSGGLPGEKGSMPCSSTSGPCNESPPGPATITAIMAAALVIITLWYDS